VKDSRVLWIGDRDLILSTGFDAVSLLMYHFNDTVFISVHCLLDKSSRNE